MHNLTSIFVIMLLSLACGQARAAGITTPWVVDHDKSSLTFQGVQNGQNFTGHFASFTSDIVLDPAHLDQAHIKIVVKTGSAITDDASLAKDIMSADWLSTEKFPDAVFESRAVTALGADKEGLENYAAHGTLTLLGVSKDLTLPFTLAAQGDMTRGYGDITLKRLDYGVGASADSKAQTVGNDVVVRFDITAHR